MSGLSVIRYSERVEETELLGPGKRAVLWVYGCCFDCPGCIAWNFRHGDYSTAEPQEMAEWFLNSQTDGFTISGGEPFLQAETLALMIEEIKKVRDVGIIVYTGFLFEQLVSRAAHDSAADRFLNMIDILIDGPYLQEENHNEPYRGSSNQRILQLTDRYRHQTDSYYFGSEGRNVEIRFSREKTLMIGVPGKDQAEIWSKIKERTKEK